MLTGECRPQGFGGPPMRPDQALSCRLTAARTARLYNRQPFAPEDLGHSRWEDIAYESGRLRTVSPACGQCRRIADRAFPAGPLDRESGHARASVLFGLGVGDRNRQDVSVFAYSPRDGPF